MRAKLINETTNFERGLDPKEAMNIGGIILEDVYIDTVVNGIKQWQKYLDGLTNKKVTFHLDKSQYASQKYREQKEAVSFIVKEVSYTRDGGVTFKDQDDMSFYVDTAQKIYVK